MSQYFRDTFAEQII